MPKDRTSKMNPKDKRRRVRSLLRRDGASCWLCRELMTADDPPTIDHVVSRKAGGTDALVNLRLAHAYCNNIRSNPHLGRRREQSDGVVA